MHVTSGARAQSTAQCVGTSIFIGVIEVNRLDGLVSPSRKHVRFWVCDTQITRVILLLLLRFMNQLEQLGGQFVVLDGINRMID